MIEVEIGRAKFEDIELINELFEIVLIDTFQLNGISDLIDTFNKEINDKRQCLNQDFESGGKSRYFLIAKYKDIIVGSVEYGPANELIVSCTNGELKELMEIGTVFVHPDYQRMGIGRRMLNAIIMELEKNGIEEFCLDSGYKSAQKIWINKFGYPHYFLKDYWGKNVDHMVWRIQIKEVLIL
ncbi:MAG: GNAT family N-acetyltransferase [Firmicutes bacterium HGW-Firmicutes-1]|nr:MAG: GNAT family N-acetyltransferase [Firmicutes bacterium HGW-Firmicutes-1]